MNRIQILRGDIKTYLESNKLFDGQLFIQETASEPGFYFVDAVTGYNVTPQPGELYAGISIVNKGTKPLPNGPENGSVDSPQTVHGVTRIGSSRSVLNNFHLEIKDRPGDDGKGGHAYINIDQGENVEYAQNFITSMDLISDAQKFNWKKFREGQLYVYYGKTKYTAPDFNTEDPTKVGLYTIDDKPAKLSEKDAFILLGEIKTPNGEHTHCFYIIKLTGGSDGSNIEIFPDDPDEDQKNIVDQVHAFFKDKTLIDSLYDIDRLKLSHYESQDPNYAIIPFSCNAFGPKALNDKLYIVNKTNLLKKLVSWYTGISEGDLNDKISDILTPEEMAKFDLGADETVLNCAIARIQGTEFHIIAKQRTAADGENVIPQNLPFFIVTDKDETINTAFTEEGNKYTVNSSVALNYIKEFGPGNNGKQIPAFFPGDEIVVKIKPAGAQGQKPSEHQRDDGHYVMSFDIDTEVEITRRGDISNPVLMPDDIAVIIDPEQPNPWGDRVNSVTTAYWKDHDNQTLLTANDVIKDLRKTKADVDESGHIFTSQLPKTVIGGLQRRGSLNTEQLYAFLLGCTYTEGNEPDSIETKLTGVSDEVKAKIIENLKAAKIVGYTDGTERDAENGDLTKLIPNIDVGDYFIYSGNKIKLLLDNGSYDASDPTSLPYKLNDINDDTETAIDESYNNDIKFGELRTDSKVADILDLLIKDGDNNKGLIQNKSFWLNPGDLIIIDDITKLKKAVHNVDDEDENTTGLDTEDGFVKKISIIAGSENSVSGIVIKDDPEPVTGQVKLEPKLRGPGYETTIEKGENSKITIGNNAVLWKNDVTPGTGDWGDNNIVTGIIPTVDPNGYARKTNEQIKKLRDDNHGLIHEIINAYRNDEKTDINGFLNVHFRTDVSQSPVLNLGLT